MAEDFLFTSEGKILDGRLKLNKVQVYNNLPSRFYFQFLLLLNSYPILGWKQRERWHKRTKRRKIWITVLYVCDCCWDWLALLESLQIMTFLKAVLIFNSLTFIIILQNTSSFKGSTHIFVLLLITLFIIKIENCGFFLFLSQISMATLIKKLNNIGDHHQILFGWINV